ncbi:unnamed protein product [Blepharisma stoltei]|uniref:Transposase n=1 Tax=Blepharisma stoltei TaxID=1481888 RepID=A0AAU9JY09_9CILI|nr:unnamed protein product [Blepharisma stoltei]
MIEGISKIIPLSPPSSSQWTGRLSKLSPIAEILSKIAELCREISIDESMIKYKGHHISKQYVKKAYKLRIQGIYIVRFKNRLFMKNPGKSAK